LDGSFVPTPVLGLDQELKSKVTKENGLAFAEGRRTFQPFKNWEPNASNVNEIIDNLSDISDLTESTRNKVKIYRLVFSNNSYWDTFYNLYDAFGHLYYINNTY
jgi:hypothetical protein